MNTDTETDIALPCAQCGADPDEPCAEECVTRDDPEEHEKRLVERALRDNDVKWQAWLTQFAVSIQAEIAGLKKSIDDRFNQLEYDLEMQQHALQDHSVRIARLDSTLPVPPPEAAE